MSKPNYKTINKEKYDRALFETCQKAAANGDMTEEDAHTIYTNGDSEEGITEIEMATMDFAVKNMKMKGPGVDALKKLLADHKVKYPDMYKDNKKYPSLYAAPTKVEKEVAPSSPAKSPEPEPEPESPAPVSPARTPAPVAVSPRPTPVVSPVRPSPTQAVEPPAKKPRVDTPVAVKSNYLCRNCGNQLMADSAFCRKCGTQKEQGDTCTGPPYGTCLYCKNIANRGIHPEVVGFASRR